MYYQKVETKGIDLRLVRTVAVAWCSLREAVKYLESQTNLVLCNAIEDLRLLDKIEIKESKDRK